MAWADTGLRWIKSSPNIPRGDSPLYYVATGIVGNLSGLDLGIGTSAPFELVAAPYLNADSFTASLRSLDTPGVSFSAYHGPDGGGSSLEIDPHAADEPDRAGHLHHDDAVPFGRHAPVPSARRAIPDQLLYKIYGSRSMQTQVEAGFHARSASSRVGRRAWNASSGSARRTFCTERGLE